MDNGVSVPDPTHPCVPKLGADGGEDDYLDLIFLFHYQILTTEFGELLLWQDIAQSTSQPPNFSVSQQRKPKTGRLAKSQFKCQGQPTKCMVKQTWETTQSNSYKHFPFLNSWVLFLDNFVLSA